MLFRSPKVANKNFASFEMNYVCTGTLLNKLVFHTVSETKQYTFDQDISFEDPPAIREPETMSASAQTSCTIGPNWKVIYGGETIVQKFLYTLQDSKTLGHE